MAQYSPSPKTSDPKLCIVPLRNRIIERTLWLEDVDSIPSSTPVTWLLWFSAHQRMYTSITYALSKLVLLGLSFLTREHFGDPFHCCLVCWLMISASMEHTSQFIHMPRNTVHCHVRGPRQGPGNVLILMAEKANVGLSFYTFGQIKKLTHVLPKFFPKISIE